MNMRGRTNRAKPGTGTQYATFASKPDDDDHPNSMRINGTKWKCGHDYLDTELADVVELVAIIGKSSWCDTREPEEGPEILVFEAERAGTARVDPHRMDFDEDRFIERYTRPAPVGAPESPW